MSSDPTPITAFDISADGTAYPAADLGATPPDGIAWRWLHFDLSAPGVADWATATLPALPARTLLTTETRPRVDVFGDGLILTLRGINRNQGAEVEDMVALRLWITPRLVVSMRRRRIFVVEDLRAQIEAGTSPASPADFIALLTEGLVSRIEAVSLSCDEQAEAMEDAVYDDHAEEVAELAPLRRMVIKLRRHVGPQTTALEELAELDHPVLPEGMKPRLNETANRAQRTVEELQEVRDRLTALSEHLDLIQNARMSRNGYVLSAIAAIFLPLGFLTGLFGVNLAGIPGTASPWAFVLLCLGLTGLGLALFGFLRWKRWL